VDAPLHRLSLAAAARLLGERRVTAEALTRACLDEAARHERLNAFIVRLDAAAVAQARAADREIAAGRYRGPLHGIPITIKDLIDLRGVPTTAASRVRAGHVAPADAAVVARLREAGAVFLGKTNLHEFAFGVTSEDSAFGPARHPRDPSRSPGGSSGGSAAAVALGLGFASIGTDTGGSIRIPAAACGVVGFKPPRGDLPLEGVVPLSPTLDHVGPIARSVRDARLVYEAMRGTGGAPRPRVAAPPPAPRLGLPRRYFLDRLDREVRRVFDAALGRLAASGCTIDEVTIPHAGEIAAVYLHISLAEAARYHAPALERDAEAYTRPVRLRLELGRYVLAEDYLRALDGRRVLHAEVEAALEGRDALVLPTLPVPAPPIGASTVETDGGPEPVRAALLRLTQLFNLTGHPAITIPCGETSSGWPCGCQLVGRLDDAAALLDLAETLEPLLAPPSANGEPA
jgi:aspartyl-tRNA(Asn)/glutamyl-tRNA(Gln) amidotransferase subunit A